MNLQHSFLPAATQSLALGLPCPHRAGPTARCIFFASGQKDFGLVGDVTRERIFLSPNYLENRNCLFLPSVPIFVPEQAPAVPKAGVFPVWRGLGRGLPCSRLFPRYLVPHSPCTLHLAPFCTSPLAHLDLSLSYLSESQMGLDCLIREESRHRVIWGQTAPELLPGQRSVPH